MTLTGTRAVLFDLDGTLVASAPDLATAVNRALVDIGREPVPEARIEGWIGNGARRLVARALTGEATTDPELALWERAMDRFNVHYAACLAERTTLYPGVRQTLARLTAHGLALGVVTNKPACFTGPVLTAMGLADFFGVTVAGDTLGARKPDAEPMLYAARMLGVPAEATVMVGDAMTDVGAARAAGMGIIWVPYGYHRGDDILSQQPEAVAEHFEDLPGCLGLTENAVEA
jgi:phosphoglycolate phosphatase